MFCKYCGTELPDGTITCSKCGKVLNKSAKVGKKLREQGDKHHEMSLGPGILKADKTSKAPFLAFIFVLATVVLGIAFVRLTISGSQTQGLAAIIVTVMAMTGNRKLVPYMAILEMLVDGYGVIDGIAVGIFGAAHTPFAAMTLVLVYLVELGGDVLYISALLKGEKGQTCAWRYLPVLIMVVSFSFMAISGPKTNFLMPILALICNLPFAAYRYVMIRWMFNGADSERKQ